MRRSFRKTPPPILLSDFLPEVLDKLRLSEKLREQQAILLWNRAVGKEVKKHTKPYAIENGTLVVLVDNSAWMNELIFLKKEIIKKLNELIVSRLKTDTKQSETEKTDIVKDIRFRLTSRL
ncbi:MAG: DUF721 domain-containing protein [candidate division WOR-3 bacterium]